MIKFEEAVYEGLIDHAKEGDQYEICGVLAGEKTEISGGVSKASDYYRCENVSETPRTNYLIEPEEQLEVIDKIEEEGEEVVGFYHSHPEGPNHPSETDEDRATWPDHTYVIVSLRDDEPFVGAWRWTGEEFVDEEVSVVSD